MYLALLKSLNKKKCFCHLEINCQRCDISPPGQGGPQCAQLQDEKHIKFYFTSNYFRVSSTLINRLRELYLKRPANSVRLVYYSNYNARCFIQHPQDTFQSSPCPGVSQLSTSLALLRDFSETIDYPELCGVFHRSCTEAVALYRNCFWRIPTAIFLPFRVRSGRDVDDARAGPLRSMRDDHDDLPRVSSWCSVCIVHGPG